MRLINRHSTAFFLGLLFIIISIVDFSTPASQLAVSIFLMIGGLAAAGILFRAHYANNRFLIGIEIFIFLIAVTIATGVVVDIGMNWNEFQARK